MSREWKETWAEAFIIAGGMAVLGGMFFGLVVGITGITYVFIGMYIEHNNERTHDLP